MSPFQDLLTITPLLLFKTNLCTEHIFWLLQSGSDFRDRTRGAVTCAGREWRSRSLETRSWVRREKAAAGPVCLPHDPEAHPARRWLWGPGSPAQALSEPSSSSLKDLLTACCVGAVVLLAIFLFQKGLQAKEKV